MRVFNGRGPLTRGGVLSAGGLLRSGASVNLNPTFSADYVNDTYFIGSGYTTAAAVHTVTRSTSKYVENTSGLWTSVSANTLARSDKGALIEVARTNVVLWNRDLTNAAWTKTNITAAKDQTGIDGVANSASSITATAGNGTCLQAITLASSARWQTAFVKRLTGSGTVQMTMDNGTTWTTVTVTAGWTRVAIPTQTLLNPTVGFRLVTSGDAIAVDFVQNENSATDATSPIATTTVAVARSADVITIASSFASYVQGSAYVEWEETLGPASTIRFIWRFRTGATDAIGTYIQDTTNKLRFQATISNVINPTLETANAVAPGNIYKSASRWGANDYATAATAALQATVLTNTAFGSPSGTPVIGIGQRGDGLVQLNGYLRRIEFYPRKLTDSELISRVS